MLLLREPYNPAYCFKAFLVSHSVLTPAGSRTLAGITDSSISLAEFAKIADASPTALDRYQFYAYTDMTSVVDNKKQLTVLGIDIGTTKLTVSSLTVDAGQPCKQEDLNPLVLSSDTGSKSIPPLIGFRGKMRHVGETAALEANSNAKNTLKDLVYFLGGDTLGATSANLYRQFKLEVDEATGKLQAVVNYNDKETKLGLELLVSMLVRTARSYCKAEGVEGVSFTTPVSYTEKQRKSLVDAALIAELKPLRCVDSCVAMATMFEIKHAERIINEAVADGDESSEKKFKVVFVDMGHTSTSVALVQYTVDENNGISSHVVSSVGKKDLGARNIDDALFNNVVSTLLSKHKVTVTPASKVGSRVLRQCNKAKEILSTIGETSIVLENLPGDVDARISLSQSTLEESSKDVAAELKSLFDTLFNEAGEAFAREDVKVVEISGGGVRIPFVKRVIEGSISTSIKCQTTLSPEAMSKAAAIVAAKAATSKTSLPKSEQKEEKKSEDEGKDVDTVTPEASNGEEGDMAPEGTENVDDDTDLVGNMNFDDIKAAQAIEREMKEQDSILAEIGDARNALESYIYEMRSVCNGNGGNDLYKLLDTDKLLPLLTTAEDWMYESDDYTKDDYTNKLSELTKTFNETSPEYFEAVEKERLKVESELNEGEKIGDAERALESENAEDDHDRRKLKKDDRMRLVVRNKDEGTELFKGGVYKQAAIRYTKETDEKEVNEIKVKLHLNIAMCFLKMDNMHKVINNCTDALELDSDNVKALFRRATAYYKEKKIKEAKKDLKHALKISPEDKALKKLNAKVDLVIKKQKAKEKKMAQRMFG